MSVYDGYYEGPYAGFAGGATFARRCTICGRIVKADETIFCNEDGYKPRVEGNATCSRCGRVEMPFLGFYGGEEQEEDDE